MTGIMKSDKSPGSIFRLPAWGLNALLLLLSLSGSIWSSQAQATLGCEILPVGQTSFSGAAGSTITNLSFQIVDLGACPALVTGTITVSSDTTGGASVSTPSFSAGAGNTLAFDLTLGPLGNQSVTVLVDCTDCFNGQTQINYDANTNTLTTLAISSGNNQTGFINTALASPLVVLAQNDGFGASDLNIDWVVTSGDATLSSSTSVTDGSGLATIDLTFGPTPGPVTITATRSDDLTATVTFTATSTLSTTLAIVSGNNQTGAINTALAAPLTVLAQDNGSNATGVTINWAVTTGSATLNTPTSLTDNAGQASVDLTFGATPGVVTVTGTRADDLTATVTFTATSTLTTTLSIVSGNNQTGAINTTLAAPLTVLAQDNGSDSPDITINWVVTSGSATLNSPSSITDDVGEASVDLTLGATPGVVTVTGTRADDLTATVTFTATATSGLIRTLVIVSGNNQSGALGSALAAPLIVQALDNGAAAPDVGINWAIASGSGSMAPTTSTTDDGGDASSTLTLGATAGNVKVTATRADDATVSVTFSANSAQLASLPGLTADQLAIAKTLDAFCPGLQSTDSTDPNVLDLRDRCNDLLNGVSSDPGGVVAALDELFADVALVQSESGLLAAEAQFDNIKARIAALRSGTRGTSFGGLALNTGRGQLPIGSMMESLLNGDAPAKEAGSDFSRWGFFAAGTISHGNADPGTINPAYDFNIKGLTVGADYRQSDKFIVGGSLGYTKQNSDLSQSQGKLDTSGWSISAYSTFYQNDSWYSDAVLSFGHNNYDMERRLSYSFTLPDNTITSVDQFGTAGAGGGSLSFAASFGRDFNKGAWGFGPYLRALYTRLNFDSLTEQFTAGAPGSGLGLVIDSHDVTSVSSVLGGKVTYAHSTNWGVLIPHMQLEWQHEFKSDPSAVEARFLYDPTATPFTIQGDDIDSDYFRFGLGMSIVMAHGRSGFFYYEKVLSRERISQDSLALGLRLEF